MGADILSEVRLAYRKRQQLTERLAEQNRYIGDVVLSAREAGHSWVKIGEAAGTSDVAVLMAARRAKQGS